MTRLTPHQLGATLCAWWLAISLVVGVMLEFVACGVGAAPPSDLLEQIPTVVDSAKHVYELALDGCRLQATDEDRAVCKARVESAGKPLLDALEQAERLWCSVVPDAEGCP